jgi:hypothetical protein
VSKIAPRHQRAADIAQLPELLRRPNQPRPRFLVFAKGGSDPSSAEGDESEDR